jgi:glycosyltransferase involved in cell wall biosynthesis
MLSYLKAVTPRSAQRAGAVIAVSEATKRDLVELYDLPPEKIHVVPHGVSTRFTPLGEPADEAIRLRYRLPAGPFILSVGTLQPRKNYLRLVRALAAMHHPAHLVIAGGTGWAYEKVRAEVERLGLWKQVTFAGFAGEADLPGLYRLASVFAYPALYEGFGLPVLEAMACGTAVVTSNVSSLPEAAGEAALLVDPLDERAIAHALDHLLGDEMLRARLVEKGLARAAEFTWERAARRTLEVYRSLL